MSRDERILKLIPILEKLDENQIEDVSKVVNACLIIQTIKKSDIKHSLK